MVDIRRAGPGDLDRLVELHREFSAVDAHSFDIGRATAAFAPLLDDDRRGVIWIVDAPPAYAVLTWGWSIEAGGAEAVLDEIFVSERDAGVGSSLIQHVPADGSTRTARVLLETEAAHLLGAPVLRVVRHSASTASIWMDTKFVYSS